MDSFFVDEVALYESATDEHHSQILLHVKKRALSTFELLKILSEILGVKARDIGYAGLKDKASTSTQYITLPRIIKTQDSQALLERSKDILRSRGIEILKILPFQNKLRIGHLKGNNFTLKLDVKHPEILKRAILESGGFANYFGPQRFGKWRDNYLLAIERLKGGLRSAKKVKKGVNGLLISSLQSHYFNLWLKLREDLSFFLKARDFKAAYEVLESSDVQLEQGELERVDGRFFDAPIALLPGDLMMHYPFGKLFELKDPKDSLRFRDAEISFCQVLPSANFREGRSLSWRITHSVYNEVLELMPDLKSSYRYAYVWPRNVTLDSKMLSFFLPKGAYASVFVAHLAILCHEFADV